MGFKCRNCGSNIKYNINKKNLECESCGSFFAIAQYSSKSQSEISYGVFHCKSCGAELLSLDEEQSVFCSYCGTQAFLAEKTNEIDSPKKIIPFRISKQKVKEEYQKSIDGQWFLPKEFKDAEFLEEFRGIYIPYWQTSVDIEKKDFDFKGTRSYTSGGYDYNEKYDIGVRFEGNFKTGANDASVAFDDTIADSIAPYKSADAETFQEGYFAGFYADKATVPGNIYLEAAKDTAINCLDRRLHTASGVTLQDNGWKSKLKLTPRADEIVMYPVWFLTWRRKNRVAYSVANGQTGKITTDMPVDYKEFFKWAGLSTLVLFALLSLLPIFVLPLQLAGIAFSLMWASTYILYREIKRIKQIECHDFDYGFTGKIKKNKKSKKVCSIIAKIIMGFIFFIAASNAIMAEVPDDLATISEIVLLLHIFIIVQFIIDSFRIKNKMVLIPIIAGTVIYLAMYLIALQRYPQDYYNYIISFLGFAAVVMNALTSMYYFNYLTTRPVPNFFKREGANHKYEAD